jgi:O-antigen ligase
MRMQLQLQWNNMRKTSAVVRDRLAQVADSLVVAVAVSLPWSTSLTSILIGLWLIALIPELELTSLRREIMSPAGGLPVVLWVLGAIGMLWANVSWGERIDGLSGFHKLLVLPLLLAQFRHGGQANWVCLGFLASCATLLALSWGLAVIPGLTWRGKINVGVPVKDYILQSELFAICAFGLIGWAVEVWRSGGRFAFTLAFLSAAFVGNLLYVQTARTTLVVMAVLLVVFGLRNFGWRGAISTIVIATLLSVAAWFSSPYLRERVTPAVRDVQLHDAGGTTSTIGLRLGYWKTSLALIAETPVLGHGTGAIPELFRRGATAETDPQAITTNPHNQILVIALCLGFLGTIVLIAMWVAHLALFRERSLISWFGLIIVLQNMVSCLFNSHLFDFSQGWLYIVGVGVLGGSVLHQKGCRVGLVLRTSYGRS